MATDEMLSAKRCSRVSILYILWLSFLASVSSSILTLQVEPNTKECFYEDLPQSTSVSMEFEVTRGGLLDVKLTILDPNNNVVFEKLAYFNKQDDEANEEEGKVTFTSTTAGVYQICFDNTMSRWTAKVISFRMLEATKKAEPIKFDDLQLIVDSVIKISEELISIESLQHHMRIREQNHRDALETTNSRAQWMSVIESVLLIGITVFQLNYIRQWFTDSDKRTRV